MFSNSRQGVEFWNKTGELAIQTSILVLSLRTENILYLLKGTILPFIQFLIITNLGEGGKHVSRPTIILLN